MSGLDRFKTKHVLAGSNAEPAVRPDKKYKQKHLDFVLTTREQSDRLNLAKHYTSERLFRLIQFLSLTAYGGPVKITDRRAAECGISRRSKPKAIDELEHLGLITVTRANHHAAEITLVNFPRWPRRKAKS